MLDGRTVFVRWKHTKVNRPDFVQPDYPAEIPDGEKELLQTDNTTCFIEVVDDDGARDIIASGSSVRYHTDKHDKELGKEWSLRFALDELFPLKKLDSDISFTKEQLSQLTPQEMMKAAEDELAKRREALRIENKPSKDGRRRFWDVFYGEKKEKERKSKLKKLGIKDEAIPV